MADISCLTLELWWLTSVTKSMCLRSAEGDLSRRVGLDGKKRVYAVNYSCHNSYRLKSNVCIVNAHVRNEKCQGKLVSDCCTKIRLKVTLILEMTSTVR